MKVWQENYGQDADGNRGMMITDYELEYTTQEQEEIAEILYNKGYTSEDTGSAEIEYEGIDYVEVDVEEYVDELKALEEADENI